MSNGTVITRARSPIGDGFIYYVDGGPGGMVQVTDTSMIDIPITMACLAWEMDVVPSEPVGPEPRYQFKNNAGWR